MLVGAEEPVVDWGALLDVLWASAVGGIGVTAFFAVGILGATRFVDSRRAGAAAPAVAYALVTTAALLVVAGAIVFGVTVMTHKS